jgi:hypothetical protein
VSEQQQQLSRSELYFTAYRETAEFLAKQVEIISAELEARLSPEFLAVIAPAVINGFLATCDEGANRYVKQAEHRQAVALMEQRRAEEAAAAEQEIEALRQQSGGPW